MTHSTHTFGVFDTCLVRVYSTHQDLLSALAEQMLTETMGNGRFGPHELNALVRARIAAHGRATALAHTEDVGLAAVYESIPELETWGITPARMLEGEIALERASVRPIVEAGRRIEAIRQHGGRVIFISDNSLPDHEVRRMLTDAGMAAPADGLYVSGQVGFTKRSGNLFGFVLTQEDLTPDEVMHYGSDRLADGIVPRRFGISAEVGTAPTLSRYEESALKTKGQDPRISGQIAGAMRAVRLSADGHPGQWCPDAVPLIAGAVAPLFVSFVAWVLQQARLAGVTRLYFVARDGQVLYRIAQKLVSEGHDGPELRYLYGSRHAWYPASIREVSPSELDFLLVAWQSMTPADNLRKLHLTPDDISEALARHDFPPATWERQLKGDDVDRFWGVIMDPEVVAVIEERAERARRLTLEYLTQEGLLDDDSWALVDIGWSLTSQRALKRILTRAGQAHTLGYYLALDQNRTPEVEHGKAVGLLVEERDYGGKYPGRSSVIDNKGLIDQVFTLADHGRTLGYVRDGDRTVPTLDQEARDPSEIGLMITLQETMGALAHELAASGLAHSHVDALVAHGQRSMDMFLAKPARSEVQAIAWIPVSYDPNDVASRTIPLAQRITIGTLAKIARDLVRKLARGAALTSAPHATPAAFTKDLSWGISWLEGSAALSGPPAKLGVWGFKALNLLLRRMHDTAAAARRLLRRPDDRSH